MKTRKSRPIGVYWINLERSKERRKNMLELLKDPVFNGMTKHRIEAYDGGDPNVEKKMRTMIPMSDKLSVKEYACLLSHLKTILSVSKSNHEYALILEDDASLEYKPYWKTTIMQCIHGAPYDWDIIQVCFFADNLPDQLYSTKHHHSTTAYLIRRTAAKKLMKMYYSSYYHLDNTIHPMADIYLYKALKTYTYRYPFFTYTNKDTTIFDKKELIHRNKQKEHLKTLL